MTHTPSSKTGSLLRAILCACCLALVLIASPNTGRTSSNDLTAVSASSVVARRQFNVLGRFAPPAFWPADSPVIIHVSVLPDGRVLFWGRDKVKDMAGNPTEFDEIGKATARIWNPATGLFQTVNNITTNLFCSGHSFLPDGRLFVAGGHKNTWPNSLVGDEHTNIFNPATNTWSNGPTMEKGRWYPFTVTLETGEVAIVSGTYQNGTGNPPPVAKQYKPELYNPQTNALTLLNQPNITGEFPNYPYIFLDPRVGGNRGVFIAGPSNYMYWNPRGGADGKGDWSTPVPLFIPGTNIQAKHLEGSAVMYDSEQGKILLTGGRRSNNVLNVAQTITLNQDNPLWQGAQPMNHPRTFHTSTLLPDGKVLVTGGVPCYTGHQLVPCFGDSGQGTVDLNQTKAAEMWDPATGLWTDMASNTITRSYHSTAILLPDATVLVGGHGLPDGLRVPPDAPNDWNNRRRQTTGERNIEIYSPPYLFDAAGNLASRPVINTAPAEVAYGQPFGLSYANATGINRVAWIRLPSVTHGFNTDQRINVLPHSAAGPNQLMVTPPSDPRKCPPGYYMLFVFNQNNTPSVAKIIKISPSSEIPPEIGARAAVDASGRLHLFYRYLNGQDLRYIRQTTAGVDGWSPSVSLGGALTTHPVVIADTTKRLWVFVGGTDNAIYVTRQNGAAWQTFYRIGGARNSHLAVARNVDGRIQVFFRGTDNALWYIRQTTAGADLWDAPVSLGGFLTSEPAVAMNSDGRLEVFVKGSDDAIYANPQNTAGGTTWAGFYRVGGTLSSAPAVARNADGRLQLFYRTALSRASVEIYTVSQNAPGDDKWSDETSLGGTSAGVPIVARNTNGALQVFIQWQSTNELRTVWQTSPGGSFTPAWLNLGGALSTQLWMNPPVLDSAGRMQVFVRGAALDLYNNRQVSPSSSGSWSNYFVMGDFAHGF